METARSGFTQFCGIVSKEAAYAARLLARARTPALVGRTPKGRLSIKPVGAQLITGVAKLGFARALDWADIGKPKC